jgi:hypothetical protein
MRIIGEINDEAKDVEWAESADSVDYFLKTLPRMMQRLHAFQEDATTMLRPNMRVSFLSFILVLFM